jgi:hypothetical protein
VSVQGTSVISKLVGEREYAVGGSQKLQEKMVRLSLHIPL